jgi:DNA-binding response OmpR family regulator/anti-sigma regulatory factor (Ser/Thr protein kinase)
LVSTSAFESSDGEIVGGVAVIQDITALEDEERLRSEFLGLVSHELKTPLTAIKGAAATALDSYLPLDVSHSNELFEIVNEQADRLRKLVDNLLDLTSIEAGALSVRPERMDLGPTLEEAKKTFRRAGFQQLVHVEVPNGLPAASADPRRVAQVLSNLLSNAARHSPEHAPITITAEQRDADVVVRIKDRGWGFTKAQRTRLFKKFSRLPGETGAGLGLGLVICRGIVAAHGGRIWAESAGEGTGATFSFTLPLAPAAADQEGAVDAICDGERKRVFVIDDDPQVVRYLRRALADAGHDLIEPSSWVDIASQVEGEELDLILLDLLLPGTDGFEILKRIRRFSDVPVIFLTARDDSESVVRALRLGADDYVSKPFSPSEVLARIDAILRRRDGRPAQRAPFSLGGLRIDLSERRVTVDGKPVSLTKTEYKLLSKLAANAGQVLTHDQILDRVWGEHFVGGADLIRAFIRSVRRKLGDDARQPRYLLTERGVGYRMAKPA